MARYHMAQEQIDLLDIDQLESLRHEINEEMYQLGQTEHKLYQRRRELELLSNPDLAYTDNPTQSIHPTVQAIINAAIKAGISPEDLLESIH